MKRMKYLGYVMVVMLMVVALALACAPEPEAPPPEAPPPEAPAPEAPPPEELPPIKIAHIGEFTGFASIYGPPQKLAMEYALDEIGWEIEGRNIELISEDGGSDPATAVDKARKLVESDKVDVIIGPLLSSSGAAVIAYLQESGAVNVGIANHGTELGGKMRDGTYRNIFLIDGVMPSTGYPLGIYAYEKLGYRTAALVESDYVAGHDFNGGFQVGFEEKGGKVVQIQRIPLGTVDFAPYLTALKKVDVVSYFLPGTALPFHKQYYDFGVGIPLLEPSHDCLIAEELQELGDNVLGLIGSGAWSVFVDTPENKAFVEGWTKRYGRVPQTHNETAYTAIQMFLEAVRYTKGDTSYQAIIDALHKVKVDAPRGTVWYTPDGLGVEPIYIFKVVKVEGRNDWKPIAEYPMKHIWEYPTEPTK